jgi:osmotically-inducible protein OsmY
VPGVVAVERGIRTDDDLARDVREAISRDLGASAANLDVRSEFGRVDIVGRVRDAQALRRIDAAARQVPGVLVMHNLATVG